MKKVRGRGAKTFALTIGTVGLLTSLSVFTTSSSHVFAASQFGPSVSGNGKVSSHSADTTPPTVSIEPGFDSKADISCDPDVVEIDYGVSDDTSGISSAGLMLIPPTGDVASSRRIETPTREGKSVIDQANWKMIGYFEIRKDDMPGMWTIHADVRDVAGNVNSGGLVRPRPEAGSIDFPSYPAPALGTIEVVKAAKCKRPAFTLKVGKELSVKTMRPKTTLSSLKNGRYFLQQNSNEAVCQIIKGSKIRAIKPGKCNVFIFSNSRRTSFGVATQVKITVRK